MEILTHPRPPIYHRQKLLMYMLQSVTDGLSKIDLHKLMLLYMKDMNLDYYDFVPYKFGGFSFVLANDLRILEKQGWIVEDTKEVRPKTGTPCRQWDSTSKVRRNVTQWMRQNVERGDNLIRKTYLMHPYYALNSVMKDRLLNADELSTVLSTIEETKNNGVVVYTIGYEGLHLETWLNKLIQNRVSVLCDVRSNPISRKFGFSKSMLQSILPKLNIEYRKFPELGVTTTRRKSLNSKTQYKILFDEYKRDLQSKKHSLDMLVRVVKSKRRVALNCFEAEHRECHRHCISDVLKNNHGFRIVHL